MVGGDDRGLTHGLLDAVASVAIQTVTTVHYLPLIGPISSLVEAAVAAGTAVAVIAVVRVVLTERALGRRVRLQLRPPDDFDPDPESIGRFVHQLRRVPGYVGRLVRPAAATRIHLDSAPDGEMRYCVELPCKARGVLEGAMYPDVEAVECDEDADSNA